IFPSSPNVSVKMPGSVMAISGEPAGAIERRIHMVFVVSAFDPAGASATVEGAVIARLHADARLLAINNAVSSARREVIFIAARLSKFNATSLRWISRTNDRAGRRVCRIHTTGLPYLDVFRTSPSF